MLARIHIYAMFIMKVFTNVASGAPPLKIGFARESFRVAAVSSVS
jgi:hypothetical protein